MRPLIYHIRKIEGKTKPYEALCGIWKHKWQCNEPLFTDGGFIGGNVCKRCLKVANPLNIK